MSIGFMLACVKQDIWSQKSPIQFKNVLQSLLYLPSIAIHDFVLDWFWAMRICSVKTPS